MPRLPVLIRQNRVFELVVAGYGYGEICETLQISEDTVARDMVAIGDQVRDVARERAGEVLAVALATFQWVLERARAEYEGDLAREEAWYRGQLDFDRVKTTIATKTLAAAGVAPEGTGKTDEDDDGKAFHQESAPLEVKRTVIIQKVRPQLRGEGRSRWLQLIADTTREMVELLGIKKLVVEHQGGAAVPHVHMTLEQWRALSAQRLSEAESTFTLLGDDAEGDDA